MGNTTTEATTGVYTGEVALLVTAPASSKVPDANWDVTVKDSNGVDILAGGGLNRSSGSTQTAQRAFQALRMVDHPCAGVGPGIACQSGVVCSPLKPFEYSRAGMRHDR